MSLLRVSDRVVMPDVFLFLEIISTNPCSSGQNVNVSVRVTTGYMVNSIISRPRRNCEQQANYWTIGSIGDFPGKKVPQTPYIVNYIID